MDASIVTIGSGAALWPAIYRQHGVDANGMAQVWTRVASWEKNYDCKRGRKSASLGANPSAICQRARAGTALLPIQRSVRCLVYQLGA